MSKHYFLGAAHTLEPFRDWFYRPAASSTANYECWACDGQDTVARASETWRMTVAEHEEQPVDQDLKVGLKAYVDRRRKELAD